MPAQLDFKAIAEEVDICEVARHLGLELTRELRSPCPACQSEDRAIELIEDTNTFRCWAAPPPPGKKVLGGDCITLYAHVRGFQGSYRAAKELSEIFGVGGKVPVRSTSTSIAKHVPEKGTAPQARQKAANRGGDNRPEFDPQAFLEKLEYTDEVAATGLSEEDAKFLGVGFHRGKLYQAARWPNGDIACFTTPTNDSLKFPKTLVRPKEAKVIRLEKQRA
jgi:hypothetical protein